MKVYRWLTKAGRTLKCWSTFFWRGQKPHDVKDYNALIERICRSVRITN